MSCPHCECPCTSCVDCGRPIHSPVPAKGASEAEGKALLASEVCVCVNPARLNIHPWACGNCCKPFTLPAVTVDAVAQKLGKIISPESSWEDMGESGKDVYRNMAKDSFAAITAAGGQIFTHHDMEYLLESRPISPAAEGSAGQFVQTPQSANPSCQMCGKEMVRRYEAGEIKAWPWVCKSCGATTKPTEPGSAGQPHADNCPANLRNIKITFTQGGNAGCTPTPWKEGESVFIPAAKCTCGATGPTEEGK